MKETFPCPKCGFQSFVGQQFCGGCGQKLQHNCPHCGAAIDPSLASCPHCYEALDWAAPPQEEALPEKVEVKEQEKEEPPEVPEEKLQRRKKVTPWLIAFIVTILCIIALFVVDTLLQ